MKYLFSIVLFLSIISCRNDNVVTISNKKVEKTHVINVPKGEVDNNVFLKEAKYIFLDSSHMLGKIQRILFSNDKIFIHDVIANAVVVYSETGNYLFHIKNIGKGPGEYLELKDFTIDENNKQLVLFAPKLHKVIRYSIETKQFIGEEEIEFYPQAVAWNNNSLFFYNPYTFNYADQEEYCHSLIKQLAEGGDKRFYFKVQPKLGNFLSDPNPRGFFYGDHLYYKNRFEPKIYAIDNDSVYLSSEVHFSDNEAFPKALGDAIQKGTRFTEAYMNCSVEINNYCETQDIITFKYFREKYPYSLIYSKQKKQVVYHKCRNTFYTEKWHKKNISVFFFPTKVKGDSFVSILPNQLMMNLKKEKDYIHSLKKNCSSSAFLRKLKSYTPNDNPVLAVYKFQI
ncbi:6-bladed beta-propeller [Puteibacter caeruleilacunae]|nr:6-bladed beta-propeller [Puteibacter caeruleilacunae]